MFGNKIAKFRHTAPLWWQRSDLSHPGFPAAELSLTCETPSLVWTDGSSDGFADVKRILTRTSKSGNWMISTWWSRVRLFLSTVSLLYGSACDNITQHAFFCLLPLSSFYCKNSYARLPHFNPHEMVVYFFSALSTNYRREELGNNIYKQNTARESLRPPTNAKWHAKRTKIKTN